MVWGRWDRAVAADAVSFDGRLGYKREEGGKKNETPAERGVNAEKASIETRI